MTNAEAIARVRSTHKLFGDTALNDRSILAELRGNAAYLVNQKTNQRRGWNTSTIFTPIECLEMEEVNVGECCGVPSNAKVSRSKLKIPPVIEGNYAYLIQGVYDINSSIIIKYAPLNRYINILKINTKSKDVYYWLHDNHLYISSPYVKRAKLVAMFDGDVSYEVLYPECDCSPKKKPCLLRLEEEFKCPGNLVSAVVSMTSQSLLNTYFKIPKDQTSDGKDDQTNRE